MDTLVKIAEIGNEVEALALEDALTERGIPHLIRSYYDSALDGLFQHNWGWGHVEAPEDRKEEVMEILYDLRNNLQFPEGEGEEEEQKDKPFEGNPPGGAE